MPEAPTAPVVELSVLSGYEGQRLAHQLVRQVWSFLGGAQDVAPFQVVTIHSFLGWHPNQEYTFQPHGCFCDKDGVAERCLWCLMQGVGGRDLARCETGIIE